MWTYKVDDTVIYQPSAEDKQIARVELVADGYVVIRTGMTARVLVQKANIDQVLRPQESPCSNCPECAEATDEAKDDAPLTSQLHHLHQHTAAPSGGTFWDTDKNESPEPEPPKLSEAEFRAALSPGLMVDVKFDNKWHQGIISNVLDDGKYRVQFIGMAHNPNLSADDIWPLHTGTPSALLDEKRKPIRSEDPVMQLSPKHWHWSAFHVAALWKGAFVTRVFDGKYYTLTNLGILAKDAQYLLKPLLKVCGDFPYLPSLPPLPSNLAWSDIRALLPLDQCVFLCRPKNGPAYPDMPKFECNCEDLLFVSVCKWLDAAGGRHKTPDLEEFKSALKQHIRWQFISPALLYHDTTAAWVSADFLLGVVGFKAGVKPSPSLALRLAKRCACTDAHC
jgi:hypothetical protein